MSDKAYIEFRTHAVIIYRDSEKITCFKFAGNHTSAICDIEYFDNEVDAGEYIIKPFPRDRYQVLLHQE